MVDDKLAATDPALLAVAWLTTLVLGSAAFIAAEILKTISKRTASTEGIWLLDCAVT